MSFSWGNKHFTILYEVARVYEFEFKVKDEFSCHVNALWTVLHWE